MKYKHSVKWVKPFLVGLCVLFSTSFAWSGEELTNAEKAVQEQDIPTGQLPHTVSPEHYDLHLSIDPREKEFSGEVVIELNFSDESERIWLHGQQLRVTEVELKPSKGKLIKAQYQQVESTGVAEIKLAKPFGPGQAKLKVKYEADFNLALEGLYRVDEAGESYAFTQFEAISARLAFPGFDQPDFKVPFDVRLTVPSEHVAIANTPKLSEAENDDGSKTIRFATSKPLPTYLVAFAVGPFDVIEGPAVPPSALRDREIPLRGIAVKGKGAQFDYALENTAGIVEALESYFGIPYPYAKLDLIAVPDFNAGAMENVGAITYREVLLLMDAQATPQQIRSYKSVHSHELAHQWFGNLVTPVWWDDIWLNEAFATWMGHVALDIRDPKDQFRRDLLARSARAMATDSLASARQIRQPILSSHDIASAFDGITYSKGGGVLSMFERYLGFEAFRKGVTGYLKQRSWGNATADDFVAAISAQAAEGQQEVVASAFQSFLEQPGLPVLETSYNCGNIGDDSIFQVRLQQHRYLPLGSDANYHQQWKVPACIAYSQNGERKEDCRLLDKPLNLWLFKGACPDWVMANAQGAGYYRFNHSGEEWMRLLGAATEFSPEEQIKLADSFVAAFVAGGVGLTDFLDGTHLLAQLPTRQAVVAAMNVLSDVIDVWSADQGERQQLQTALREVYAEPAAQAGLANVENYEQSDHQHSLVNFQAMVVEDPVLRRTLMAQAAAYVSYEQDDVAVAEEQNLSLMDISLGVAVEEWGLPFVEHLYSLLKNSQDPVLRRRIVTSLASARDGEAAARVREMILDPNLRNNEIFGMLFSQIDETATRAAAWAWFQQDFDKVLKRVPEWAQGRMAAVGSNFCSKEEKDSLNAFFGPKINELGGGPRTLANTLERIDLCIAQRSHYQSDLDHLIDSAR